MSARNNQQGFAIIEAFLILVVVGILGFTGWFVYHSKQVTDEKAANGPIGAAPVSYSYDTCIKAPGSKILQTYPEQCTYADGKATYFKQGPATKKEQVLVVKEWGVQMPLTADIVDAKYTVISPNVITLSTAKLDLLISQIQGCRSGLHTYLSRSTTNPSTGYAWSPKKVGSYYYYPGGVTETECVATGADINAIWPIQKELSAASQALVAH